MKDVIGLRSRGNNKNFLKKVELKDDCKTYQLVTPYSYRCGQVEEGKNFVDPSGGPFIVEGEKLEEAEAVIKSIEFEPKKGTFITFE